MRPGLKPGVVPGVTTFMLQVHGPASRPRASDDWPAEERGQNEHGARRPTPSNAVAEASSSSRANAGTLAEGATATVLVPSRARWSRSHDRVLGMTDATSDEPIPTINRPNPKTNDQPHIRAHHQQPQEPDKDHATRTENTRPSISTADTCHPFGVAPRDRAVPAC